MLGPSLSKRSGSAIRKIAASLEFPHFVSSKSLLKKKFAEGEGCWRLRLSIRLRSPIREDCCARSHLSTSLSSNPF